MHYRIFESYRSLATESIVASVPCDDWIFMQLIEGPTANVKAGEIGNPFRVLAHEMYQNSPQTIRGNQKVDHPGHLKSGIEKAEHCKGDIRKPRHSQSGRGN